MLTPSTDGWFTGTWIRDFMGRLVIWLCFIWNVTLALWIELVERRKKQFSRLPGLLFTLNAANVLCVIIRSKNSICVPFEMDLYHWIAVIKFVSLKVLYFSLCNTEYRRDVRNKTKISIPEHIGSFLIASGHLHHHILNPISFMLNGVSSLVVCHQSALLIW